MLVVAWALPLARKSRRTKNIEQVGSTVSSVKSSVDLEAQKDANIKGSSVIAGKDINIIGEEDKL